MDPNGNLVRRERGNVRHEDWNKQTVNIAQQDVDWKLWKQR